MNRRQIMAALPLIGSLGALPPPAFAQRGGSPQPPLAQPALPMTVLAEGLKFPEAPVVMKDGGLLFVQIPKGEISRLTPDGKVELFSHVGAGPNGLAVGPDGALYIANNGGRFAFTDRPDGSVSIGGTIPDNHRPGVIQRLELKSRRWEVLYDKVDGKPMIAPDDLVMDGQGGMWITEFGKASGEGAIYYATADGKSIKVALGGLNAPNGVGVSPDGKHLHVSMGRNLLTYDIIGPGKLATNTYPDGLHSPLVLNSTADSLKVMADGKVAVCSLMRPGGIGVHHKDQTVRFYGFPDRFVTNIAFGGADMRDAWITLSDTGRIARVRWPAPGLKPVHHA